MKNMKIFKPIFIVGVPRSGTTLLYDLMAYHKDLAFFSQLDLKNFFPEDFLRFVYLRRRIFETRRWQFPREGFEYRITTTFEVPHEFNWFWNKWIKNSWSTKNDVNKNSLEGIENEITNLLERKNKNRFLSKNPSHSLRMEFLNEIFPDAFFVNIIRDPRAVVTSMTRASRRFNNPKGYFGLPLKKNNQLDFELFERHARQWNEVNNEIQRVAKTLSKEQYCELKYEDLISSPQNSLNSIFEFCNLPPFDIFNGNYFRISDQGKIESISDGFKNMNSKFEEELKEDEIRSIMDITKETRDILGYA